MTTSADGWGGLPDLGLNRVLDLSRAAVRRRTVRRRLGYALALLAGPGAIVALGSLWPRVMLGDTDDYSLSRSVVGLVFMGAAVVASLLAVVTMVRSGTNPLDNRDPLRYLARSDRAWVRARVAAGAPVAPQHRAVAVEAAEWMARQTGTVPSYLALSLMGTGLLLTAYGGLNLAVGLVLLVEGAVLSGLSVVRARTARRWLSFYAGGSEPR